MGVSTQTIQVETAGFSDMLNLTEAVAEAVRKSGLQSGMATVFVPGSTAGITTLEFEDGAIQDFKDAIERLAPRDMPYAHNERWHDGNGFAHVRAALLGPSLSVPFRDGRLLLGTWQQITLVDFDNRPRRREVIVQLIGE